MSLYILDGDSTPTLRQKMPKKTEEKPVPTDIPKDQVNKESPGKKSPSKLKPMRMDIEQIEVTEAQHAQAVEGPQFTKLKLKKPQQKPKEEVKTTTLPKIQLKSRIKHINDWPPQELKPQITCIGSVRQYGQLSRNIKEAAKLKKKPSKVTEIPDLEKVQLEKPEEFDFLREEPKAEEKSEELPNQYVEGQDEEPQNTNKEIKLQPEDNQKTDIPKKQRTHVKKELQEVQAQIKERPKHPEEPKPEEDLKKTEEPKDIQDEEKSQVIVPDQTPLEADKKEERKPDKKLKKLKKEKPSQMVKKDSLEDNSVKDETYVESIDSEPVSKHLEESSPLKGSGIDNDTTAPIEKPQEIVLEKAPLEADKKEEPTPDKKPKKIKKEKRNQVVKKDSLEDNSVKDENNAKIIDSEPVSEHLEELAPLEVLGIDNDTRAPVEKKSKKSKAIKPEETPQEPVGEKIFDDKLQEDEPVKPTLTSEKKSKTKLTPIKIERKELEMSKPQHAESVEGPQFTKLKLKKAVNKPKQDTAEVKLPKFQLKSRIKFVFDWPPDIIKPTVTYLGSVRQNGILSRNVKEAEKIKKKIYKQPKLPDIEKVELEKPEFGYADIVDARKQSVSFEKEKPQSIEESAESDEPEQFTIKPKRPSLKKTEEIEDEVTIKKKLKTVRKPSVTLPEITEPETVTFRPKSIKTKEDVEQEFNIHLDSYAEEEISLTSKVKLKPHRQPTFSEEANEASIKFYEEKDDDDRQEVIEILDSDEEHSDETANVMMSLKKPKKLKDNTPEEIMSTITMSKPRPVEKESEISQDISIKLDRKPKYHIDDQEEVSFDVKRQTDQYTEEELSLSSKIKLKPKKKITVSEAADETLIRLKQEFDEDSQAEEIILSETETEENVELKLKRKPKKPAYEVSEVEELSIELKPKRHTEETYEEEALTISAKRKPRKPSKIQGTPYKRG